MSVSRLYPNHVSRAATFENPSGAPNTGGTAGNGRKGAPWKLIRSGERITLAQFDGPGTVGHFWLTISQFGTPSPEFGRAQILEITYAGVDGPSVSVPACDYFGAVHGLLAPYASALTAVNEGRGYNSRVPIPFTDGITIEYHNRSDSHAILYYQVDVLLGPLEPDTGFLHATFRRENPTTLKQDFVVWDGLEGPGRFLGWTGGVRTLDGNWWWGEGEMKFYIDGDTLPTICGTGTEDYLDSGWGLGTFSAPEAGAPLVTSLKSNHEDSGHEWISFYRWHMSDPVVFSTSLKATIQQIGAAGFREGQEAEYEQFKKDNEAAGNGWFEKMQPPQIGMGLYERQDDWCGTAFVYLQRPQSVPLVDVELATQDLANPKGEIVRRTRPVRPS